MIDLDNVTIFLAARRLAIVGASDDKANFGGTLYRRMRDLGYEVLAVHPTAERVAGDVCYPNLAALPVSVDHVMIVVNDTAALDVVDACIELGVSHVWLFKGLGGRGAVSDEATRRCRANGIDVVAGACPLMFLEPVGGFHKLHRRLRRLTGSLAKAT